MKIKNLTGKVFFNLTVICQVPNKTKTVQEAFEKEIDKNKSHPKTFEEFKGGD